MEPCTIKLDRNEIIREILKSYKINIRVDNDLSEFYEFLCELSSEKKEKKTKSSQ